MANKTGKAYAFCNYEGKSIDLYRELEESKKRANFPDNLRFTFLNDKLSKSYSRERKELPTKIAQLAEATKVYGSVESKCSPETFKKLFRKPVKASSLRHLVMAEAPEVNDCETAGMMHTILSIVAEEERKSRGIDVSREAVFYQDSRGRAQRYI